MGTISLCPFYRTSNQDKSPFVGYSVRIVSSMTRWSIKSTDPLLKCKWEYNGYVFSEKITGVPVFSHHNRKRWYEMIKSSVVFTHDRVKKRPTDYWSRWECSMDSKILNAWDCARRMTTFFCHYRSFDWSMFNLTAANHLDNLEGRMPMFDNCAFHIFWWTKTMTRIGPKEHTIRWLLTRIGCNKKRDLRIYSYLTFEPGQI